MVRIRLGGYGDPAIGQTTSPSNRTSYGVLDPGARPSTTRIAYEWPATWKVRSSTDPRARPDRHAARPVVSTQMVASSCPMWRISGPSRSGPGVVAGRVASMVDWIGHIRPSIGPPSAGRKGVPTGCHTLAIRSGPARSAAPSAAASGCNARNSRQAHSECIGASPCGRPFGRRGRPPGRPSGPQEDVDVDRAAGAHRAADCDRRPGAGPRGADGPRDRPRRRPHRSSPGIWSPSSA